MNRRKFIKKTGLASVGVITVSNIVYASLIPKNYILLAFQDPDPFKLFSKDYEMTILNNKPWNIEAKAHLLDNEITPNKFMFIRNNGLIPEDIDVSKWTLIIDGESVLKSKTYPLQELKAKFRHYTYQLTLECDGNGRSEFNPPAKGNQWPIGAVSCAERYYNQKILFPFFVIEFITG